MKILTRYIFKEMLGPTILGFSFYTFIILMRNLFDLAGMIIKRSLPAATVGRLLMLSLPHIVVLTVPMSLLFGILIAIGRLSSDSEIIAMRALGISTRTIYRPVFIFSFLVFLVSLYLTIVLLPKGNTELKALKAEVFTSSVEKDIRPRIFYDSYENLMIYVNDVDPRSGVWKGVFIADSRPEDNAKQPVTPQQTVDSSAQDANALPFAAQQRNSQRIIIAETGTLSVLQPSKQVWMNLHSAWTHVWDPRKPDRYDLNRNAQQRMRLPDKFSTDQNGMPVRSLRELNLRELFDQARMASDADPEVYRLAKVEIHKKFAIPFACVVFGVLGLPLGITNRRGGKSSGFSLSIAIILFYYVMLNNGEHLAASGKIGPAIGMCLPNAILLALGIYLLIRANRDTGMRSDRVTPWRRAIEFLVSKRRERQATRENAGANPDDEPMILNRLDINFPNTLDRYILREFIKILLLVIISTAALFVIVDYTDMSGDIRAHHVHLSVVISYYKFLIFSILNYTLPISVLVATLVTFGMFSKNNEVTAFKSGGVSLYRVALPIVVIAVALSILAYFLLDFVLPYSNRRVDELRDQMKGKKTATMAQTEQRLWFLGKGRYIINFLSYNRDKQQLSQVQVFEFHPTEFRLTRRVYAAHATWDGSGWVFDQGWMRSFSDNDQTVYTPITTPVRLQYQEKPEEFATEDLSPDQMTFAQLRRYIENVRRSGYAAEELSVKLYEKTSWPFLSLVMALIALPFAFRVGKRGALYGVGIALALGILYWMVFASFTKFGEVGNLSPVLSAWSANILFSIAAIYLFLNVET